MSKVIEKEKEQPEQVIDDIKSEESLLEEEEMLSKLSKADLVKLLLKEKVERVKLEDTLRVSVENKAKESTKHRGIKGLSPPSEFSGEHLDNDLFLDFKASFETYVTAFEYNESQSKTLLINKLKSHALKWYKVFVKPTESSWTVENIFEKLEKEFTIPENEYNRLYRQKLKVWKQLGDVNKYITGFRSLCLKITTLGEVETFDQFMTGLKRDYFKFALQQNVSTLNEAIESVRAYDIVCKHVEDFDRLPSKKKYDEGKERITTMGDSVVGKSRLKLPKKLFQRCVKEKLCFGCGSKDHGYPSCTADAQTQQVFQQRQE